MGKMFTKPGPFGDTYLYDGNGKLVGRGFTDSHGTTRFTGTDGKYIGRSDPGLFGSTKLFNADGSYKGTSVESLAMRPGDVSIFDCKDSDEDNW